MPVVYVLHFDCPLAHAEHYAGCTSNLRQRLARHAAGHGSNLCRVLREQGIGWRLGGCYQVAESQKYRIERAIKDSHHLHRYCEYCSSPTNRPDKSIPISLDAIPFPTRAHDFHPAGKHAVRYQFSDQADYEHDSGQCLSQQLLKVTQHDKTALGWIPIAGTQGLTTLYARGLIQLAIANDQVVGYTAYTVNLAESECKIQQTCVTDEYRLEGIGQRMVDNVANANPDKLIRCNVREDLPANLFWQAIGFEQCGSFRHATSGNLLHTYTRRSIR